MTPEVTARTEIPIWLVGIAVISGLLWGFWGLPLSNLDEGAFTEATRQMLASGNFFMPSLDGEPRTDKPILIYWLQAASVAVFGLSEFALRLPSVLASLLWAAALYRFSADCLDRTGARVAVMLMALALYVGIIGKAAVADALLNLFIALTLFDIYRYALQGGRGRLYRIFLWLGLGFLTKGPVAVFFPLLVSGLFFVSRGEWRRWLAAVFHPGGLAIFVAIVLPWHVAVYLDSGWTFFEGFYLHHNVGRYADPMEGHGGSLFYYVLVAPLVVLPFSGWFVRLCGRLGGAWWQDPLERFLWLWFLTVLVFFSFSGTKLPHYLLYGISPVFVLLARHRSLTMPAWLAYGLPLLVFVLAAALPQIFNVLAAQSTRAHEQLLFAAGAARFDLLYQVLAVGLALLAAAVAWRVRPVWRALLLIGVLQAAALNALILPRVFDVLFEPLRSAALIAREAGATVVRYRVHEPSFSVYRGAPTPAAVPQPDDWVLLKTANLADFRTRYPARLDVVRFQGGPITLLGPAP